MNNIKKNVLLGATALGLVFAFSANAKAESTIDVVREDALLAFSDGSYTPVTWNGNELVPGETKAVEPVTDPGTAPLPSETKFKLKDGKVETNLAAVAGSSYEITDPTGYVKPVNLIEKVAYNYTKIEADGSTSDVALVEADISEDAVLSKEGYYYKVKKAYRVEGKGKIDLETEHNYVYYQFKDAGGNTYNLAEFVDKTTGELLLSKPLYEEGPTLGENVAANLDANEALKAYNNDKKNYETVLGYYNTSNVNFQEAVKMEMVDQKTVDEAVESYRQDVGKYIAEKDTYENYDKAATAKTAYEPSLSHIIDNKANEAVSVETKRATDAENDINAKIGEGFDAENTVAKAISDLDGAIGNRQDLGSANAAVNAGTATSVAEGLKAAGNAIGDVDFSGTKYALNATDVSTAIRQLDASMAETQAHNEARFNAIDRRISNLRDEMREGLAATAALAGLVPLDNSYRSQLSMALGGYENKQAVALGGFHYLKDNIILNAGISYGGSHSTAYKVGVTFGF